MTLPTPGGTANAGSSKLEVIALISGGKDSLFSILHCLANGHDVVALANLHPPALPGGGTERLDDIDSFMYQTIGHEIIPLYAEALGIPLFREEITGSAVDTGREYSLKDNGDDETEDLVPLLERVVKAVPGANAVSTGAILSTYQRTRVESIAIRLGLTPLSYLWQYIYLPPYRQTSLLDDMRNVGQDARIIKVASGGLDESFLWEDVAANKVIGRMKRRMEMFGGGEGGAVIGEGGEFETLALSGPQPLWKKRITIQDAVKVSGEGGSASACLTGARLVDYEKQSTIGDLRIPDLLDDEFSKVLDLLQRAQEYKLEMPSEDPRPHVDCWTDACINEAVTRDSPSHSDLRYLSNIMSAPYGSTKDQTIDITHVIRYKLFQLQLPASAILHTTILLRDMSSFATVNPIHASLFNEPNPPSRVTVSCGELMPKGIHVAVSLVVDTNRAVGRRRGLHVQSRSYWAPANIGPYSQAVSTPLDLTSKDGQEATNGVRFVHVAGQIPLVPASMETVKAAEMPGLKTRDDFIAQSVLSLQHMWRIGRAMEVSAWTGAVAFISRCSEDEAERRASIACETWFNIHHVLKPSSKDDEDESDQPEEQDVWDIKNRVGGLSGTQEERDTRPPLPDYTKIDDDGGSYQPPVFVAEVQELPRAVDIEWCSTGIATTDAKITYASKVDVDEVLACTCSIRSSQKSGTDMQYVAFPSVDRVEKSGALQEARTDAIMVYTTRPLPATFWQRWPTAALVPCFSIWSRDEDGRTRGYEVLLVMRSNTSEAR